MVGQQTVVNRSIDNGVMMSVPFVDKGRCAQEPIHIPGRIQPHGVLFVITPDEITITSVSENVETMLGRTVAEVVGAPLALVFGPAQGTALESAIRKDDVIGLNPMQVSIDVGGLHESFECVVSRSGERILIELERCGNSTADEVNFFEVRRPIARLHQAPDIEALATAASV
jgi:chemotaxis family two-component system sensor kinase Cph1